MKVSLTGLYDPKTNAGLEDIVIVLCRFARLGSLITLNDKKGALAASLSRAKLDGTNLNVAIIDVIYNAEDLLIDFNELNENTSIDVTQYDYMYGGVGTASEIISGLRSDTNANTRRLEIIAALCFGVFKALHNANIEEPYEEIEDNVRKLINFNDLTHIDATKFNALYSNFISPNVTATILQRFGANISIEKPQQPEQDFQDQRPEAMSPRNAILYFRDGSPLNVPIVRKTSISTLSLRRFSSFIGFTPINTERNESSSRATSPTPNSTNTAVSFPTSPIETGTTKYAIRRRNTSPVKAKIT